MPPVARTHTIPPPTPELLTESFCERCGTRYTFESAAPKSRRPGLGRARVLTRGLKNWVVEDGRSIEAAMADARRDEERTLASAQLEAFHQTFNFCMDCRQYTCTECWNHAEGRCLSCAPMPGQVEAEAAAAAAAEHAAAHAALAGTDGAETEMAWPTVDLTAEEAARGAAATAATPAESTGSPMPYVPTDLRPVELPEDEVEMVIGVADVAAAEPGAVAAPEPEPMADAEPLAAEAHEPIVEPEPEPIAAIVAEPEPLAAEPEPEPLAAVVEPEPIVEPEPEPIAAIVAEPEPLAAEPEPEPIAPPQPPATRAPAPAWTIVAPDAAAEEPGTPSPWPPHAPVYQPPAKAPAAPRPLPGQLDQPSWPSMPPVTFTVPAAQAVWEESSLGVISRPGSGVQACVSCGLPLSATARFCRRCGSRQG